MPKFVSHGLIKFLNALPTTKIRILVSLGMSVYVILAAIHKSYAPTMEILAFLLISQGIDVSQYMIRQKTVALETTVNTTSTPATTPPEPVVPTQPTNISDLG